MGYKADEVKVGLVIIITLLILAGFIIAILGLRMGRPTKTYTTSLKYVGGIESGQIVRFGGMQVGKVSEVSISEKNDSLIQLRIRIDETVPVKTDSEAYINSIAFVGDYYLEISTGTETAPLLPPGSEIPSREAATFNDMLASAQAAIEKVNAALVIINDEILREELPQLRDQIYKIAEAMTKLLNDVDVIFTENRQNIDQTLNEITMLVHNNRGDIRVMVENFRSASSKLESLADSLDLIVAENRDELNNVIVDIREAAVQARSAAERIDELIRENSDDVTLTIENLKATSINARDASEEISEQPWRLFWRTRQPERQTIEK